MCLRIEALWSAGGQTQHIGLRLVRVQGATFSTHLLGLMLVGVQGPEVKRSVVPEPGACSPGPAGHTTQQPSAEGRAEALGGPTVGHAAAHTASRQAVKHRVSSHTLI
jgi:hypothetical protein